MRRRSRAGLGQHDGPDRETFGHGDDCRDRGSGRRGAWSYAICNSEGIERSNIDRVPSPNRHIRREVLFLRADVTDYGQTLEALAAATRCPDRGGRPTSRRSRRPPMPRQIRCSARTSRACTRCSRLPRGLVSRGWCGLRAKRPLGCRSSVRPTMCRSTKLTCTRRTSYALSKVLGEEMARQSNRWTEPRSSGCGFPTSWSAPITTVPVILGRPDHRKWNLWGYVDESHVAESVRLALQVDIEGSRQLHHRRRRHGHEAHEPRVDEQVFPDVPVGGDRRQRTRHTVGHQQGSEVFGYSPIFSWRELFEPDVSCFAERPSATGTASCPRGAASCPRGATQQCRTGFPFSHRREDIAPLPLRMLGRGSRDTSRVGLA